VRARVVAMAMVVVADAAGARAVVSADNEEDAFGLVTGFLPAGLRMALYEDACSNDETTRDFVYWLRRHNGKALWRPTWEAAKAAQPTDVRSDYDGDDDDDSGYDDNDDFDDK
jgi:hypothetical protein